MRRAAVLLLSALLLSGCANLQTSPKATPTSTFAPTPTATLGSLSGLHFHRTSYALGAFPTAIGPWVPPATFRPDEGYHAPDGAYLRKLNGQLVEHPVDQALLGLYDIAMYRQHADPSVLHWAEIEAAHLVSVRKTSTATGTAWWYAYPFNFVVDQDPANTAYAPWYSGMAQGMALELFTDLYTITGDATWRTAADHTFASFLYPLKPGESPTARPWIVQVDKSGYLWIEEYPKPNPNDDTINGLGFAVYGLLEYSHAFKNPTAELLAQGGLTTFLHGVKLVRHPGGVCAYSVSHLNNRPEHYHLVVTGQLEVFARVTGSHDFAAEALALFQDYHLAGTTFSY